MESELLQPIQCARADREGNQQEAVRLDSSMLFISHEGTLLSL